MIRNMRAGVPRATLGEIGFRWRCGRCSAIRGYNPTPMGDNHKCFRYYRGGSGPRGRLPGGEFPLQPPGWCPAGFPGRPGTAAPGPGNSPVHRAGCRLGSGCQN